ncbi:hypothetical protein PAXINDRAFT_102505 [Paxillus involutus ATCC 200175]|uniref:Uncharacterized protein n=1 Tax=Paxillus involutus ATCC 200175 TaxID=664439 RepID=A0A0C9SP37_PAXIN|nr:hypothetical protein PAXINDRAFT_102505 [Paxillus involutus ATCC 200175]
MALVAVMVLRVYAIYHGSRMVLGILLTSYILTIIVDFVATGIVFKSPEINVSVMFGTTICTVSVEESPNLNIYYYLLPSGIFNVLLCGLAVAQFVRESLQMHKATTRWRSNRYLELLVKGSVMYFVAVLFTNIAYLLSGPGTVILEGFAPLMVAMVSSFSSAVLPARLILAVRGGHSRIVGGHVNTGFGVISHRLTFINENIVFARPASEESTENLANNINYGAEEISDVV